MKSEKFRLTEKACLPHIGGQVGLHGAHYAVCQAIPNLNMIYFNSNHTLMCELMRLPLLQCSTCFSHLLSRGIYLPQRSRILEDTVVSTSPWEIV